MNRHFTNCRDCFRTIPAECTIKRCVPCARKRRARHSQYTEVAFMVTGAVVTIAVAIAATYVAAAFSAGVL